MNYRIIFISLLAVLFLTAGPAWAAQPLGLNSFVKDTPAIAADVNTNFNVLEKAIPVMWASIDQENFAIQWTSNTPVVINALNSISVPNTGILLINGSVFVKNDSGVDSDIKLNLLIDGAPPGIPPPTFLSYFSAFLSGSSSSDPGKLFTLSYTYAADITAGPHNVSQTLTSELPPALFTYNKNNLTVIFFPDIGGAPISPAGVPANADTVSAENGLF